jgi:hypothetical protein
MILDMSVAGHNGQIIAIGAASVSVTLPAGTELVGLSASGNCHFRFTNGASTAVATDPMMMASSQIQTFKLPSNTVWTLSAIQDGSSTGNLSVFRIYEG